MTGLRTHSLHPFFRQGVRTPATKVQLLREELGERVPSYGQRCSCTHARSDHTGEKGTHGCVFCGCACFNVIDPT